MRENKRLAPSHAARRAEEQARQREESGQQERQLAALESWAAEQEREVAGDGAA